MGGSGGDHVPVVLLTGRPGSGKTTAIRRVADALGARGGGFYTAEVRDPTSRRRMGFELITLDGERAPLATRDPQVSFARQLAFSRYRVNLDAIEAVGVPTLLQALGRGRVVLVDEIGPMEILSPPFRAAVLKILESQVAVVGTIVLRPQPFADQIKAHPRVTVRTITPGNGDDLPAQVVSALASGGKVGA